jgi:hypothetical protein
MNQKEVIIQNMGQNKQEPSFQILNDTINILLELPSKIITSTLEISIQENPHIQASAQIPGAEQMQAEQLKLSIKLPQNGVASFKSVQEQTNIAMPLNGLKIYSSVEMQTEHEPIQPAKKASKRKQKAKASKLTEKKLIVLKEDKENESAVLNQGNVEIPKKEGSADQEAKPMVFNFQQTDSAERPMNFFSKPPPVPPNANEENKDQKDVEAWRIIGKYAPHEDDSSIFSRPGLNQQYWVDPPVNIFTHNNPFGKN